MTLQEVANILGGTCERIRQKKNTALRQMVGNCTRLRSFPLASLIEGVIERHHGLISDNHLIIELEQELSPAGYSAQGVLALLIDVGLPNIKSIPPTFGWIVCLGIKG